MRVPKIVDRFIEICLMVAVLAVGVTIYHSKNREFNFHEAKIVQINGYSRLRIHRESVRNIVGGFYVTIYNSTGSCSTSKDNDLIEASRTKPFTTRFISRFTKACTRTLTTETTYSVDVTYLISGEYYTKTIKKVTLTEKDVSNVFVH